MPNHVHLLVRPTDRTATIGPILNTIKQSVAKRARHHLLERNRSLPVSMIDESPSGKRVFRFWQRGGGYDRNITNHDTIRSEIRYIHANPVRAELCAAPTDWPWSSIHAHRDPEAGPLTLDLRSIPR